jgi:hypothetical protein
LLCRQFFAFPKGDEFVQAVAAHLPLLHVFTRKRVMIA